MFILRERTMKDIIQLYNHYLHCFNISCAYYKLQLFLHWNGTVNSLSRNGFQIIPFQDINHIKQQINVDWSSFYNNSLMCWHFSFMPLYKEMKTWRHGKTLQYFTSVKTLLKLLCIKYLKFLMNFHIL